MKLPCVLSEDNADEVSEVLGYPKQELVKKIYIAESIGQAYLVGSGGKLYMVSQETAAIVEEL